MRKTPREHPIRPNRAFRQLEAARANAAMRRPAQAAKHTTSPGGEVELELWATKAPRERAHPLPDRDLGQYVVHQVRGDVRHPSSEARGAEAAPAGETHHHLVTASAARELNEAVLQNPASQVRVELFLHELRQTAVRFGARLETWPVLAHQRMQERVFRSLRA
jgi:hypothetical protein